MAQGLQIGKVAREAGVGIHAIRFYERQGLVRAPGRSEGGYRLFDPKTVSDLKFIRRAQELGFTLAEIRELLVLGREGTQACSHVRELLTRKLETVSQKIAELGKLQGELRAGLRQCNRDLKRPGRRAEKTCPVLEELTRGKGRATG